MRVNRAEPQPTRSNGSVCPHHLFPECRGRMFLFAPRKCQGTLPCNDRLASADMRSVFWATTRIHLALTDQTNDNWRCMHPRFDMAIMDAHDGACVNGPYTSKEIGWDRHEKDPRP